MGFRIVWGRPLRLWGFDMEARPGPWARDDMTFRHALSLAGGFDGEEEFAYIAPGFSKRALERFVRPIRRGNLIVVAHNGMRYDLPFLNGSLLRMGLEPLPPVLVSDTYTHLLKRGRAFSASLSNMAQRYGIVEKGHMSEVDWERCYDGDPEALAHLKEYNIGDVRSTLALRRILAERGLLRPPKVWRP